MLRDDTSPVKDRIKQLAELSFPSKHTFSACNNTKQGMEKREGHPITIIPQATIVPAGVVRIMELEEQGYSYSNLSRAPFTTRRRLSAPRTSAA